MITTYKIIEKIQQDPKWIQKTIIGGLLMMIPLVNLFALGFLYRFASNMQATGNIKLPTWDDLGQMFLHGLIFLGVIFLYGFVPLLIGWALYLIITAITLGFLGWIAFLPLSIIAVIVPSLTIKGIFSIIEGGSFESLFLKIGDHFQVLCKCWQPLLIANLTFIGLQFLGLPLLGFAFFVGFFFLIPYTLSVLKTETIEDY